MSAATASSEATDMLMELLADRTRWHAELTADRVAALLAAGADVSARDSDDRTPLMLAVRARSVGRPLEPPVRLEVVELLLAAGSAPDARDRHGSTVFSIAFTTRDASAAHHAHALAVLERLGAAGADMTKTELYFSASMVPVWTYLVAAGAQRVDVPGADDSTLLHQAARWGVPALCRLFLAHGAAVNALDPLGCTPLRLARRERAGDHAEVDAILVAAGGVEQVPLDWRPGDLHSLRPIDPDALIAAAAGRDLRTVRHVLDLRCRSAQELVAQLVHDGMAGHAQVLLGTLAATLGPASTLELAGPIAVDAPLFWHGDLIVSGSMKISSNVAITGNLAVTGVVDESDSVVTIGGELRCAGLYTSGDFSVGGAIEARDLVVGYYNDCVLNAQMIRARVVISDEHSTEAEIDSPHDFDVTTYAQGHGAGVAARLRALFVETVFDDDGLLDYGAAFARLARGEPIFRGG